MRNSDRHSPLQIPFSESKKEVLESLAPENVKGDNVALNLIHHRQCHCKQTKCLKLYCACFASGYYCNGCNCADCHNNIENEDARQEAAEIILERNPNAFRLKIVLSPHEIQDAGVEVSAIPFVVIHKRGCHCKKTRCRKGYCECFQARIPCSENCKCLNCKNKEGIEDSSASRKDPCDTKTRNEKAYDASSSDIGMIKHGFQNKRKCEDIDANDSDVLMQQENPLINSGPQTDCSITSKDHVHSSTALDSFSAYRSLLAEMAHPHVIKKFCSRLVAELHASKIHPGIDVNVGELAPDDHLKENEVNKIERGFSEVAVAGGQEGMLSSPEAEALLFDKKGSLLPGPASPDRNMKHENSGCVSVHQERLILTNFRNFLTKVVSCGDMKDMLGPSSEV